MAGPAPGTTPTRNPRTDPRKIGMRERLIPSRFGSSDRNCTSLMSLTVCVPGMVLAIVCGAALL